MSVKVSHNRSSRIGSYEGERGKKNENNDNCRFHFAPGGLSLSQHTRHHRTVWSCLGAAPPDRVFRAERDTDSAAVSRSARKIFCKEEINSDFFAFRLNWWAHYMCCSCHTE